MNFLVLFIYPPIAQLVEQLPLKETVPGSSPGGRTKDITIPPAWDFVLLSETERCFAFAKSRVGVASIFCDGKM